MDRLTRECLLSNDWDAETTSTPSWRGEQPMAAQTELLVGAAANADSITARERMAWLVSTIEGEIIPRLMLAHRPVGASDAASAISPVDASRIEIEDFARLVLGPEVGAPAAHVDALLDAGVSLELIYLGLLAPTARHLGTLWEADAIDFTAVTTALWRLQHLLYDHSPGFQRDCEDRPRRHHALLAPVPGSQHTFGLLMVAEFFRRAGWDIWTQPSATLFDLVEAVHSEWFDVIGFSVGAECQLEGLASVILALRKASCNPRVAVMVGGAALIGHPEYVALVGADATADDAPQSVRQAELLVAVQHEARC
jgi:methanogenic corrinoid protein MtbC1